MSQSLTERYDDRIAGVLSCYDRVVITGTLPGVCYADGMTRYLNAQGIRIFDYPEFAKLLRDRVRDRAATLVTEAGLMIEHISKSNVRQRGRGRSGRQATRRSSRAGPHHLGDGSLRCLSALARQAHAQDLHPAGQWQVFAVFISTS
jgi:hypothetical protein